MKKLFFFATLLFFINSKAHASGNICLEIDLKTSADSNLSAKQKSDNLSLATVNGKPIYFNTVPMSVVSKEGEGALASRSEGCFNTDALLIGGNSFKINMVWPSDGITASGTGSASVFLYRDGILVNTMCRKDFGEGYSVNQTCVISKILDLQQIDPERAAQLKKNEQLRGLLADANRSYGDFKALLAKLEEKFNEISGKSFDELSESNFIGFEVEMAEALAILRSAKQSIADLKATTEDTLNQAKAKSDEIRKSIESELQRSGANLETVNNIEVPQIDDIDVKLPEKPAGEDPFDPANNPYDKIAVALIDEVNQSYPDKRFDIVILVNAWLKKNDEMDVIIQTRATVHYYCF